MLRNMSQIDVKLGIQSILGRVNEAFAARNVVRSNGSCVENHMLLPYEDIIFVLISSMFLNTSRFVRLFTL